MALKYYAEEEERWPQLEFSHPSEQQVVSTLRRWADVYLRSKRGSRPFLLAIRKPGRRWAWCTSKEIVLTAKPSWLLLAHEFAHLVQWRRGFSKRVWHGPYHRRLVDELCCDLMRYI